MLFVSLKASGAQGSVLLSSPRLVSLRSETTGAYTAVWLGH